MSAVQYTVEWFEPSHGATGTWYRSDVFPSLILANARAKELRHTLAEYGVVATKVRVRQITGKAPAMSPGVQSRRAGISV